MNIPVLDWQRPDHGYDGVGERHVQFETPVDARVDETDSYVTFPIRAVFLDDGISGWSFEIGPYSMQGSDVTKLINALAEYGRLSGDFHRAGGDA